MLAWTIKNKKIFRKTAILAVGFFVAVFLFLNISPALAQYVPGANPEGVDTFGLEPVGETIALSGTDIRLIVARIIRAVLGLLGIITLVLMLYAGFLIMTSGGNEEKIIKGKKTMINGVIGLAIILSSFAIVQFIFSMLTGGFQATPSDFVKKPYINTYSGSGALGTIVKDHYPERNQIGVKRNTSIMVTFAEAVDPSSLIENTNRTCWDAEHTGPSKECLTKNGEPVDENTKLEDIKDSYYGDCVDDDYENNYYAENCDSLITTSTKIYMSDDEEQKLVSAAAMTSYNGNGNAHSFVFKPLEPIGSSVEDVWYTVDLRSSIMKKDLEDNKPVSIFGNSFTGHYPWEFQTDVNFDFDPPVVVDVNPSDEESNVPKNRVLQITFNEAMNPLVVQGVFSTSSHFDNIVVNRPEQESEETIVVSGEWRITNGYKTVEFIPDQECGYNSCGELMYCLDVDCSLENPKCSNEYETLIRTGLKIPGGIGFASYPFTGVMDTADNALDGNEDGTYDPKPESGDQIGEKLSFKLIGEQEKVADNYFWNYAVINKIDRSAPFIENLTPDLDQGGVGEKAPVEIHFSKRMTLSSLDSISLNEYPEKSLDANGVLQYYPLGSCFSVGDGGIEDKRCLDPIWYVDISRTFKTETIPAKTITELRHRDLGPNGYDFYYFPEIPSTVKDENQNCLYPGYGPDTDIKGQTPICQVFYDKDGKKTGIEGCVDVGFGSDTDTGCVQTTEGADKKLQPNTDECVDFLKEKSI